jgi:rubrerythrin
MIERFRHDPTALMKIDAPSRDWKVAEGETLPKLSTDMKPRDAIALAMKKEQQAVEFYRALSAASSDAEVKGLFDNLSRMELGHKRRLETIFVDIGYPEVF